MNKIIINILLFFTLVIGSIGLITFDVWADTSTDDVYEIPEDYKDRNYVMQVRLIGTSGGYFSKTEGTGTEWDTYNYIEDRLYDFTLYYPSDYYSTLSVYNYNEKSNFTFYFAPKDDEERSIMYALSISDLKYDINNVAKRTMEITKDGVKSSLDVYIKKNSATMHKVLTPQSHDVVIEDKNIDFSTLIKNFDVTTSNLFSVNYPFVFSSYSSYNKYIYSGIYGSQYLVQQIPCTTNSTSYFVSAIRASDKRVEVNESGVFPEPKLTSCKKLTGTLHCYYDYPTQNRVPNFYYVYPKIYVKVDGKDWVEYQETDTSAKGFEHVFTFHADNSNKSIWGALSLRNLYIRMGYTYSEITVENFEPPKIQGIIWGVQYGYALTQNILDESSIRKSKIVFSRYVFEDNIVDTPDVGIGDLGDLPNISGSNSSIEVGSGNSSGSGSNIGSSGSHVVPAPSDSADYSDVGSFFKSLNFDFSSIGKALSGSFSLVTGFASMIGTIFQKFFGDAVGIIALLAIGICIVLRVLGR